MCSVCSSLIRKLRAGSNLLFSLWYEQDKAEKEVTQLDLRPDSWTSDPVFLQEQKRWEVLPVNAGLFPWSSVQLLNPFYRQGK